MEAIELPILYLATMLAVTALGWPRPGRSRSAALLAAAVCLASVVFHVSVAVYEIAQPRVESSEPFPAWFAIPAGALVLALPSVLAVMHAWFVYRALDRLKPIEHRPPVASNDAWRRIGAAVGAGVGLTLVVATLAWALPTEERARPRRPTPEPTPSVQRLISRT